MRRSRTRWRASWPKFRPPSRETQRNRARPRWAGQPLLVRHPRLAQADEISRLDQGADLRYPPISRTGLAGLQKFGHARMTIIAAQFSGFGEFGGGAFDLTIKTVGRGEATTNVR